MTNFYYYHVCVLSALMILQLIVYSSGEEEEPEDLSEYNLKVLLYRCSLQEWARDDGELKFKMALVSSLNAYCWENYRKCNLRFWSSASEFLPEFVIFDKDYPKITVEHVELKFVVVFHTNAKVIERQHLNCVPKEVLSTVLTISRDNISDSSGWLILHSEKFPKYDPITEFMNLALMPLGLLLGVFILLLAKMLTWIELKPAGDDHSSNSSQADKVDKSPPVEGVEWSAYKPPPKPQEIIEINANNNTRVKAKKLKSPERASVLREVESPISTLKRSTGDLNYPGYQQSSADQTNRRPANLPIFTLGDKSSLTSSSAENFASAPLELIHKNRQIPTMTVEPSSPTSSVVSTGTFLLKPKPLKNRRPPATILDVEELVGSQQVLPIGKLPSRGSDVSVNVSQLAVPLKDSKRKTSQSTLGSQGFFSRITKDWGEAAPKRRPNYPTGAKGKTKRSLMSIGAFAMGSASAARVDHRL